MTEEENNKFNDGNLVKIQSEFLSGVWSERVLVVTQDYEIKGYVFMPKQVRKTEFYLIF